MITIPATVLPAQSLHNVLAGNFDFVQLAPETLVAEYDRLTILEELRQTPFTFAIDPYPPCWGKAFENYLSMEEYLAPHEQDAAIAALCAPINAKVIAMLQAEGIQVETLVDPKRNTAYAVGDFRIVDIEAQSSILHVDDLRLDSVVKPDFVLPDALVGQDYVQLSVITMLQADNGTGTLRTYDRRYTSADDRFRLANGWQFSDDAVAGVGYYDFQPQTGDAFIMTNQYFHDIIGAAQADAWWMYSLYILYLPSQKRALLYI